ncbi:hypothetical protein GCM10010387_18060 [Streptomyces inusitatus]|uniref:Uncharacterized protein n=1 Tax=Streptomyces inusitatus TaxID=68221 RepID=A0A918UPM3_9ACTN|nr:hypothetical protein [Streptomyces inusitatus]GGZ24986.1 hypothetical protein GCM10010387_18060 [Streptomyces inusitatus]
MSGSGDLVAPPEALAQIAKGINEAHAELKDLGMIGQATAGRGFSELALSGVDLGHEGLADQFRTFCTRWEFGVRTLMQRGNGFAEKVGLSAGAYAEQERYVKDTIKIGVNSVNGNPHLSEDEVKAKGWDEIRSQTPYDEADYSAESFEQAHQEVKQTWKDTTYDVQDSLNDALEGSGVLAPEAREAMDKQMRENLDPSEAAVKQAREG